jgi:hypothetical protein
MSRALPRVVNPSAGIGQLLPPVPMQKWQMWGVPRAPAGHLRFFSPKTERSSASGSSPDESHCRDPRSRGSSRPGDSSGSKPKRGATATTSLKKAWYPARGSGSADTVVGRSRPASWVLSSRRCGARKLAEAASPIWRVARSKSKSPAASGANRIRTPLTTVFGTRPFFAASLAKTSGG